jgi:hypothetical protein
MSGLTGHWVLVSLALAATATEAATWATTGQQNLKVIKHAISTTFKFNDPSAVSVAAKAKLTAELGRDYEPTFSESVIADDRHIGKKSGSINGKNALVMFRKVFKNVKFRGRSDEAALHTQIKGLAVDVASGGKVIYSHIAEDISGVTDDGRDVPGTTVHGFQQFERYTFDDNHKITNVQINAQAEAVEDIQRKVCTNSHMHSDGL